LKRFVLDASVALAWFVDYPIPSYAIRVRQSLLNGARALVPALWHLEMANGFAVAERRRVLGAADVSQGLIHMEQLLIYAIETSAEFVSMRQALALARSFQLSAYDAVYLDTARREELQLATLYQPLRAAAARAGVEPFR
jgi:predicted nucleic acid-binding protein